jgi:hypothetical protein
MKIVSFLVNRLKEPSTYAGFSGVALALGLSAEEWGIVYTAAAAVAGVVAMFLSEKPAETAE